MADSLARTWYVKRDGIQASEAALNPCFHSRSLLLAAVLVASVSFAAQPDSKIHRRDKPADAAELAAITERGRAIAAYDKVAWHATDAVMEIPDAKDNIRMYIGRKTDAGWVVAFGKLNDSKDVFLLAYEVDPTGDVLHPHVVVHSPAFEDHGEWLHEARAIDLIRQNRGVSKRSYNATILKAPGDEWYVYIYPAQTTFDTYPVGGDFRYRVSKDGLTILETRRLHTDDVIELGMKFSGGDHTTPTANNTPGGPWNIVVATGDHPNLTAHNNALDDAPEDTDVANVLMMGGIPMVVAGDKFIYTISADGTASFTSLNEGSSFKKEIGKPR
jgi:hypothetical protein